jgi:hypothetical protein
MQDIDHLVMTTDKRLINPSGFQDVQVECSDDICPTYSIGDTLNIVASEDHRQRAPREVVGNRQIATYRHVEVADCVLRFALEIGGAIATIELVALSYRKPADGVDFRCAVRRVTEVYLKQSKVGATRHGLI